MSDVQAQDAQNPFAPGSESQPETAPAAPDAPSVVESAVAGADGTEAGAETETVVQETETEAEAEVHTHESVLTDLLTKLEGMVHLAKAEVEAIVAAARGKFESI